MHRRPYQHCWLGSHLHRLIINTYKTRVMMRLASVSFHICVRIYERLKGSQCNDSCERMHASKKAVNADNEDFMSVCCDVIRQLPQENPQQTTIPTHTDTQTRTVTLPADKLICCVPACVKLDKSVFFPGPLGGWYEKNVLHDGGKFLHCQRAAAVGFHNLNLRLRGSPSMSSLLPPPSVSRH